MSLCVAVELWLSCGWGHILTEGPIVRKVGVSLAHYHTHARPESGGKPRVSGIRLLYGPTAAVTERPHGAASGTACRGTDRCFPVEPRLPRSVQCDKHSDECDPTQNHRLT